jgi:peptidoglycan/xylan/chitin deacetylase (PgdA/CDA1 family)
VLVLHRVVQGPPASDHDVTWASLVALLDLLERLGLEVSADLRPSDSVALTFDDGTADHLRVADELARRGRSATFFVPSGELGRTGSLDDGGLRRIVSSGHCIGAHGVSHRPLAGLDPAELTHEVASSKARLESAAGDAVNVFAPPGGIGHPLLEPTLRRAGYTASRSTRWGLFTPAERRWAIPIVPVTELTLARGWVTQAVAGRSLPLAMRAAWIAKEAAPPRLAHVARTLAHRRLAT